MQRYMRGMSNGGSISSRGEPLELAAVAAKVPSIAATHAHESRSQKYAYIPTMKVLEKLEAEGYGVFEAQQSRSRIAGKENFTKHLIRLRHRDSWSARSGTVLDILLLNAHDGTSSWRMMLGAFEFLCTNGLFVGKIVNDVSVKHSGDPIPEIVEGTYSVMENREMVEDRIEEWKGTPVSVEERAGYLQGVHTLRAPDNPHISSFDFAKKHRTADRIDNLWGLYNVAQENAVRGGISYTIPPHINDEGQYVAPRRMKTKPVKAVDGLTNLNRALWDLTEHMAQLKKAA